MEDDIYYIPQPVRMWTTRESHPADYRSQVQCGWAILQLWVLGPAQQHLRSCWQPHLAGARGILISRSRSDTLGEAKALCCLEIPKISDQRGRRRPWKAASKGSGRRSTSHGQGGTMWQVPQSPTDTLFVSHSPAKSAKASWCLKNPPAAWKIKTKFTLQIRNKHKRHLVMLALSCI